jgi:hypothetical protein
VRERLLANVQTRLACYEDEKDRNGVLSYETLTEVADLLTGVADPATDFEVLSAAGRLCWYRYRSLDPSEGQQDLATALGLLAPVSRMRPEVVPEPVRNYFNNKPTPGIDVPFAMNSLAIQLLDHVLSTGDASSLGRAIGLLEAAVAGTATDHSERAGRLTNLVNALQMRFKGTRNGNLTDLDRAVEFGEEAVAATAADDAGRTKYLSTLGSTLCARYDRTGNLADLDRAVEIEEQAVAADSVEPGQLSNLALSLRRRYERIGDLADLERAVELGKRAVDSTPADQPRRAKYRSNLANTLRVRFERFHNLEDINEAVVAAHRAVKTTKADQPERAGYMSTLGGVLQRRYTLTRVPADLNSAVNFGRRAVGKTGADDPERAGRLSNLANALKARFDSTGEGGDLDEAVENGEAAVAATAVDDPARVMYLSNLGNALGARFDRTRAEDDVDRAVWAVQSAVEASPIDDPSHAQILADLGNALWTRFEHRGELVDLEEAVDATTKALATTPTDHPNRARSLSNLGGALLARFERTQEIADLNLAIEKSDQATQATRADHPNQALYLFNLGIALWARYERTDEIDDRARAVEVSRRAAKVGTGTPLIRARAASQWGALAAKATDWAQAVDGYTAAISLLAQVAPRSLSRRDQEYRLSELGGLGSQAAACCLQAGLPDRAVELWEQGRGVLFSQTLDSRTDLTRLAEAYPTLAEQFISLRNALERAPERAQHTQLTTSFGGDPRAEESAAIDRRLRLAEQLDNVITKIRYQSGFDGFLLPPALGELLAAAERGPVVLVNVSDIRSDALILTRDGVEVEPLPALSPSDVSKHVAEFLSSLEQVRNPSDLRTVIEAQMHLSQQLVWLWTTIAAPVLGHLGITEKPGPGKEWPRVWWCASGLLTLLPLHAAGHHDSRFATAPDTVIDRAISSYTPTIRALIHARRPPKPGAGSVAARGVIVVAMPNTPGERDLPGADAEVELILDLPVGQTRVLRGPDATHVSVTTALPDYQWAHFACHGFADLQNPSASHLLLHDHQTRPLTVVDVARLRLDHAGLAFLSACSTARSAAELPDEAIQLAAAFQLAGYRHVIASLWSIDDVPAVVVAKRIYSDITAIGTPDAAGALHNATRRQRALYYDWPSKWAAYTHSGD